MSPLDGEAAWCNAVDALPTSDFVIDVAGAVTNDGAVDGGKRWLLSLASDFLRSQGQPAGVWPAYDFAIDDFESIGAAWPAMRAMAATLPDNVMAHAALPALARFIAERLPACWLREPWQRHPPVTRALVIADRTHDLVGLFAIGLKPSGSKDPFALRRAANHWLMQVVSPLTIWRRAA